jgi:integrase
VPKLCLHKGSGQAFVLVHRKPLYLGKYGTPAAQRAYAQFVEQLSLAAEKAEQAEASAAFVPRKADDLTVVELLAAYLTFAEGEYRKHGQPTRTIDNIRLALRPLSDYFGDLPVREFGPLKLKALRQTLLDHKLPDGRHLTRGVINERVRIVVKVFEWGVSEELVPETVHRALKAVEGLRAGRSAARESKPVLSVPDQVIEATLPHLPAVVADMVRFQRLTVCRPGEVCSLRPCDVKRFDDSPAGPLFPAAPAEPRELPEWEYRPSSHKTEHHGKQRVIFIGPRAQEVLRPYLLRPAEAFCFTPAESDARRREAQHARRKTPLSCGNRPAAEIVRTFSPCYDKDSYAKAIQRGCDLAFPVPEELEDLAEIRAWRTAHRWAPNRLRHTGATALRKALGAEKAQVVLGHAKLSTAEIYAERDLAEAASIMRKMG